MKSLTPILLAVALARLANAQDVINYAPTPKIDRRPLVLVYGEIISAKEGHFIVQCQRAAGQLPVYRGVVAESQERLVHITISDEAKSRSMAGGHSPEVAGEGKDLQELDSPLLANAERRPRKEFAEDPSLWSEGDQLTLLGREDGTFSYLNIFKKQLTVANISHIEAPPIYTLVTPFQPRRESVAAITSPPVVSTIIESANSSTVHGRPGTPDMQMPRYNLETTLDDLKVGITSEKLIRILGNPGQINGTQWVYRRGYISR